MPNCNIISNKKTFKATDTKGLKELASHVCVFRKVKRGYISSKLRNKCLIKAGGTEAFWKKKDIVEGKADKHFQMSII